MIKNYTIKLVVSVSRGGKDWDGTASGECEVRGRKIRRELTYKGTPQLCRALGEPAAEVIRMISTAILCPEGQETLDSGAQRLLEV